MKKALVGTLTFVLGIMLGIVLFVVAIVGTIAGLGGAMNVGQVQSSITNAEIIQEDSDLYDSTLLEAIKQAQQDIQNFHTLSLKTLYEHYGINLLKGVSGIDFTKKSFYDVPLVDIVNDLNLLLDGFYLSDVEQLAGLDFASYGLPVLNDNLNVGIPKAIDNILGTLNGDLSIRAIKDNFGIDLGVEDNDMLSALQDIKLSDFGGAIDALRINTLLKADTDTFIMRGENAVYVKSLPAEEYETVSDAELADPNYTPAIGIETYIAGGDGDGHLVERELRYYRYADSGKIVVNNSCYSEDWQKPEGVEVVRHRLYKAYDGDSDSNETYYVIGYANRVATFDGAEYTLLQKDFIPLTEVYTSGSANSSLNGGVRAGKVEISDIYYPETVEEETVYTKSAYYAMTDDPLTKDSSLGEVEEPSAVTYLCSHKGTSTPVLQKINWLSIGELRNADDILNTLRIGDIVEINEDTAKIVVALKDSTLKTIGEDINKLEIGDLIDIDEHSALIMKSLSARHCTLENIGDIADSLTVGELIEIDFDNYQADANGDYVRVPVYVKYNEYVAKDIYGEDSVRGDYDEESGVFNENADGEWVETYYYTLYDETSHSEAQRYKLETEGATALAIQSIARRGCAMADIGTEMNELSVAELLRITPDSAHLFKSLAKRGSKLTKLADEANTLEIGEIILIDESASWLMRSLDRRHCTLDDLSTITDKLTLEEMIEITPDNYIPDGDGMFVELEDENSYLPYSADKDHDWRRKFTESEGAYQEYDGAIPALDGVEVFVHGAYYTLYNPALHTDTTDGIRKTDDGKVQRYIKQEVEGASSSLLQRFSSATLGGFSDAFDSLMLSDVMDIDGDLYAPADPSQIKQDEGTRLWYYGESLEEQSTAYFYDETNHVYRIAAQEDLKEAHDGSRTLFVVERPGEGTAILKKLAYVHIDGLSGAMDSVMEDLMLADIIDINTDDAVKHLEDHGSYTTEDYFFIPWDGESMINGKPVVYVYDTQLGGKYVESSYKYVPISEGDERLGVQEDISYVYKSVSELKTLEDVNTFKLAVAAKLAEGNLYVKRSADGEDEYLHSLPLATYYCARLTLEDTHELYYREVVELPNAEAVTGKKYNGSSLYVKILGKMTEYKPDNPAHCGLQIYFKHEGGTFFVPMGDSNYAGSDTNLTLSAQYAKDVYFQINSVEEAAGQQVYVYNGTTYEKYSEDNPAHNSEDAKYYIAKLGVVSFFGHAFYQEGDEYKSSLNSELIEVERLRSAAVLRLLAHETIKDMNSVIENATIGDFMDVSPGTIFDNEQISNSTLSALGTTLGAVFTDMTIGELLEWSKITTADAAVRDALQDVTLQKFFECLTFTQAGEITIDMPKLYGITE